MSVIAAAAGQVAGAFLRLPGERLTDLNVYWGAVRLMLHGGELYEFSGHNEAPFTYPPFAGLLFVTIAIFPEAVIQVLWTAATLTAVVFAGCLLRNAVAGRIAILPALPIVCLLLFLSAPVSSNIRFGQISFVLGVLVLIDCLDIVPIRYRGVATGVASAIKLTPAIFIAYWCVSGQWRKAVTACVAFLTSTALAWLILPAESIRFWFTEIWSVDRIGNIVSIGNQSLNAVLLRFDVADDARTLVVGGLGLLVVGLAFYRAVRASRRGWNLAAAVIVGAAGLVISPVSWTHHQIWLVFAALCAVSVNRKYNAAWSMLVAFMMIAPVTSVGGDLLGDAVVGNLRFGLAVAVACFVPLQDARRTTGTGERTAPRQPGAVTAVLDRTTP
ncbi:glycosyltransferase 87 family protein [Micromonospora sp. LOL_015]|uniref:glycosyltransferase 87 family protein n=1 Tax=Micromonospora sp. LOL_015 TaxID=3345416 RepID=UPI003A890C12